MITIVNYGLGNIQAIANIYKRLNIPCQAAESAAELEGAQRLILPGVGSFDWAMKRLDASGMRPILENLVLRDHKPVLGICVGLQMLARRSEEGVLPGLGWIDADVMRFEPARLGTALRLPHMGWNDVVPTSPGGLFAGMETPMRFYFLHSYYLRVDGPDQVLATSDYGGSFACSAGRRNVMGVQFHPEKSHQWGVQLLRNFAEQSPC